MTSHSITLVDSDRYDESDPPLQTQACLLLQSAETALDMLDRLPRSAIDQEWLARIDGMVSKLYSHRRRVA